MRVTTAGRYALRAMLDLSQNDAAGPVLRQDISSRQAISSEYIAQLFRPLTRDGLVKSTMGPGGGYQLALPASQISVAAILRAVEGPFAAVHCVLPPLDSEGVCARLDTCTARILWTRLTAVIENYLDSVTLEDLRLLSRQLEEQHLPVCNDPLSIILDALPETPDCPIEFAI